VGVDEDGTADDITRLSVGGELRRYVVAKGFDSVIAATGLIIPKLGRTENYYYIEPAYANEAVILVNSLVSLKVEDLALIAVPSALDKDFLLSQNLVIDDNSISKKISRIKSYAFTNMKNKDYNINLSESGISNMVIEDFAIYHSNIRSIVLPGNSASLSNISERFISGYQPYLSSVTFGGGTAASNYAFVDNFILYYGNPNTAISKTHIIYVLPNVADALNIVSPENPVPFVGSIGTKNNVITSLKIPATVSIINDYALSCIEFFDNNADGRFVQSITVDGEEQEIKSMWGDDGFTFEMFGITANPNSSPFGVYVNESEIKIWKNYWEKWKQFPIFVNSKKLDFYGWSKIDNDQINAYVFDSYYDNNHTQTFYKTVYLRKFWEGDVADDVEWATFEYGQSFDFFNPEYHELFKDKFGYEFHKFYGWSATGYMVDYVAEGVSYSANLYKENTRFKVTMENNDETQQIYINSTIVFAAIWDEYPIQFFVRKNVSGQFVWTELDANFVLETSANAPDNVKTLDQLAQNDDSDLDILLPGLNEKDYSFIENGVTYRFIGWQAISQYVYEDFLNGDENIEHSWDDVDTMVRLLPNGNIWAENLYVSSIQSPTDHSLYDGSSQFGLAPVRYFALYNKSTSNFNVTPDVAPNAFNYVVSSYNHTNENSIRIPYAKYVASTGNSAVGYMHPIVGIDDGVFAHRTNIVNEIYIGGAVLSIGTNAFRAVNATSLTFGYKNGDATVGQLSGNSYRHGLLIGDGAFAYSPVLTGHITLPYLTQSIGANAFRNNYLLQEFEIAAPPVGGKYSLAFVGDRAFAYNSNMTSNNIGNPEILDLVSQATSPQTPYPFGVGVFMGSGKMQEYVLYKYTDNETLPDDDPVYTLVHAGRMNGGSNIVFDNGDLIIDGVAVKDDEGENVKVIGIDSYAFSFSDTVNYITVKGDINVAANAFYLIGEQLQYVDMTDAVMNSVYRINELHAFADMPRCPIYVKATELAAWRNRFPVVADWFEVKKPALP
jgi:hypothetical protein